MDRQGILWVLDQIGAENVLPEGSNVQLSCPLAPWRKGHKSARDGKPSMGILVNEDEESLVHCFSGDTRVMTFEGVKPIQELVGGTVLVLTQGIGDTSSKWVETEFKSYGHQELSAITISRNKVRKVIRATAGHKWVVKVNNGRRVYWIERTTDKLIPGNWLKSVSFPNKSRPIPSPFGIAHGVVFGDGSSSEYGSRITLWGDKDVDLLKYFSSCPTSERRTPNGRVGVEVRCLPRFMKESPDLEESAAYLYGWLSGYFAADGCVDEYGCPSISSSNRGNLELVQRVCIRLGIFTYGISTQMRKGLGNDLSPLHHMRFSRRALSEDFFLIPAHRGRWVVNRDVKERPGWGVVSVEPTGVVEEVFCAEVPGTHTFALEDNILTHNCFACQFGGTLQDLIEALHQYGDKNLTKLIDKVAEMEEIDPEWLADSIGEWDDPTEAYVERVIEESEIAPMMGRMHPYIIRDRGIEVETLRAWGAGFDKERMRAVFPVRRRDGALVGMVGRAIGRHKPKYLNYFDFDKGRYLYGEHLIKNGTAIVGCEGLLDSLATWQCLSKAGLLSEYSVVSFLGSIATRHQLKKMVNYTDDTVLFLDNDPAGWSGQLGAAKYLSNKIRVFAVKYPTNVGGDPAGLMLDGTDIAALVQGADLIVA